MTAPSITRTMLAGLAGGGAFNLLMLLTFRLIGFGWTGEGPLVTSPLQSAKLVAVWTKLEPLPLVVANPPPIIAGLLLFGVGQAFAYRSVAPAWPPRLIPRATRFALMTFFMTFLFFEFFTPFNLFGEPLRLIALELVFWAVIAAGEAIVLVIALEGHRARRRSDKGAEVTAA